MDSAPIPATNGSQPDTTAEAIVGAATAPAAAPPVALFSLGQVVATPGALDLLAAHGVHAETLLDRHVAGDWGDMTSADRDLNEQALHTGDRIFSVYQIAPAATVWIITEATTRDDTPDRDATTILLPEDY
jgi:hypothetical protein